ncbi:hypothetical protein [Halofilum ochraceum]|uniref:hypothetical protein n=1 Tax=Halofilum ochraceum TaxID=1611323 RepID=UPI00111315E3|nr:hypothetical protein [Halofilum ochraceum]
MFHRYLLVCAGALALSLGCSAGATQAGKSGDATIARRLLDLFQGAADHAELRQRARAAGVQTDDYGVRVDIQTAGLRSDDRVRFEFDGVRLHHFSVKYERVAASVRDVDALHALAALSPVRAITPEYGSAGRSDNGASH